MSRLTQAKVALAVIGLVLFGAGVRFEYAELRWAGIGCVAVAWLLRFARTRPAVTAAKPREGE
jgi:hypothetical protein